VSKRSKLKSKLRQFAAASLGERPGVLRYSLFTLGALASIVLGLLPVLIFASAQSNQMAILASFGCLGWLTAGMLLMRQRQIFSSVRNAIDTIGLADIEGSLTEVIETFSREYSRFHRASYSLRSEGYSRASNLSSNLKRIVELAYTELPAASVELSLFDEESELWSQSLLVGNPTSYYAQSLMVDSMESATREAISDIEGATIVVEPLRFAGTTFGVLRIEIKRGAKLGSNDLQVLKLLAAQAGISLVNSRFTEEVLRMRQLGDETMQAKTGFLANLSHELRGPLGIILNGVELAMEGLCGEISDPLREMLRMIKGSGDHLLDLVNDVLDYAKVEAGKVKASPTDLPVRDLLEDLCAVVRTQAMAKGHDLKLDSVDSGLGVRVDKRHVRQMLINFLTNAVKYTPNGGNIVVWAEKLPDGRAKISVKDSGIGIPASQHSKVFGAFERVEDSYAQSQSGTGLGMPLTKRLAEVNDGSVGFESAPEKGSTFWLVLPSVECTEYSTEDIEDVEFSISGDGDTILLVDHNEETRSMLEQYLSKHGFSVLQATSGSQVMKLLREHRVDLAVIENDLPDLPGEEMVAAIRGNPHATSMPIILLSAKAFVFDIERFLKLGVDRCLSKPVSLAEVAITSRRLIDQTRRLEEKTLH
jgi:signal transduction histidine kinase/ActR/RegA family two-component response regulator